jgi:hypothetical protein
MNLNTPLHLVQRLMNGAATPLPLLASWFTEGLPYLFEYRDEPLVFTKERILS